MYLCFRIFNAGVEIVHGFIKYNFNVTLKKKLISKTKNGKLLLLRPHIIYDVIQNVARFKQYIYD